MSRTQTLRPTGNLERYSVVRHDLGFYNNVVVTAQYELPDRYKRPLRQYVLEACARLIEVHPILSVNVEPLTTTGQRRFARPISIDLGKCVTFRSRGMDSAAPIRMELEDEEINDILEQEHNTPFDQEGPLWRLVVLENKPTTNDFTAVFVFHHAIGDGGSGLAFHRTFLDVLRGSSIHVSGDAITRIMTPSTPLLPTLEDSLPMRASWWYLLTTLIHELIWKRWESGIWTARKPFVPAETLVRHIILSSSTSDRLRTISKQHGTSITALMKTLLAEVMLSQIPVGYDKIRSAGAMSLRPFIKQIDQDSMGVWVQAWQEIWHKSQRDANSINWQRSRQSKQVIEDMLAMKGNDSTVGLLKYISDYRSFFTSKLGKTREVSFELSNLGAYIGKSSLDTVEEQPKIGRMMFSQCANVAGPAIQVSSLTGGDGCLVLVFSWQRGCVEEDFVISMMDGLKARVELAIS